MDDEDSEDQQSVSQFEQERSDRIEKDYNR